MKAHRIEKELTDLGNNLIAEIEKNQKQATEITGKSKQAINDFVKGRKIKSNGFHWEWEMILDVALKMGFPQAAKLKDTLTRLGNEVKSTIQKDQEKAKNILGIGRVQIYVFLTDNRVGSNGFRWKWKKILDAAKKLEL